MSFHQTQRYCKSMLSWNIAITSNVKPLNSFDGDAGGLVLQTVWIVDVITWTLLVPMLTSDPDQQLVAFWKSQFYNFTSYNMVRTSPSMQMQHQTSPRPAMPTMFEPCRCSTAALHILHVSVALIATVLLTASCQCSGCLWKPRQACCLRHLEAAFPFSPVIALL